MRREEARDVILRKIEAVERYNEKFGGGGGLGTVTDPTGPTRGGGRIGNRPWLQRVQSCLSELPGTPSWPPLP